MFDQIPTSENEPDKNKKHKPSPFLSKKQKASWNSEICSLVSTSAMYEEKETEIDETS